MTTYDEALSANLLKRIEKVEKEISRVKTIGLVGLVALGLAILVVWPRQDSTIEAERFVLVDKEGKGPLASLEDPDGPGGNFGAQLRIYDSETGHYQATVGADGLSLLTCPGVDDFATCSTESPSARYASFGLSIDGPGMGGASIELDYGIQGQTPGLRVWDGRRSAEFTTQSSPRKVAAR